MNLGDALQTAVVLLDARLQVTYVNAAAETLLDGSAKRLLGTPFYSHFRELSLPETLLMQALAEGYSVADSEVEAVLHDGQRMLIEFMAQPYVMAPTDKAPHLLLELKRVDQVRRINQESSQQQQLKAAQALVRGLAHEIKNPLGGLRGAAQLLASELTDTSLLEYTDLIMRQADRLRQLVDKLLGSSQLPERSLVNLHALLEQVLQVIRIEFGDKIKLVRDYDPSLPELEVAAEALEQALLNLALNACQAMPNGGTLTLKTRVAHQQTIHGKRYRQTAVISVEDTGHGIPAAISHTLFYPMVTARDGGTGLGLSIAQTAVYQHEGKIDVDSEPGRTRFQVLLPYTQTRVAHDV